MIEGLASRLTLCILEKIKCNFTNSVQISHYDGIALSGYPSLQYPPVYGPVHTPDNNKWDTPPV